MSSQNSGSGSGSGRATDNPAWAPYEITGQGVNSQGNSYDTRSQPSGSGYHYSNADGSYYYSNGNNSTYYNNGQGESTYTAPNGNVYKRG